MSKEKNLFKLLKDQIEHCEKQWQKDIDDTKNPILKGIKQDYKDLADIETKFLTLKLKYGISLQIVYPKMPKSFYRKSLIEKLINS